MGMSRGRKEKLRQQTLANRREPKPQPTRVGKEVTTLEGKKESFPSINAAKRRIRELRV